MVTTPAAHVMPFWEEHAADLAENLPVADQLAYMQNHTDPESLAKALGSDPSEERVMAMFRLVRGTIGFTGGEWTGRSLLESCRLQSLGRRTLMQFAAARPDTEELLSGQRAVLEYFCPGCMHEIVTGQHYIRAQLFLHTRSDGLLPDVTPTLISANVHHPGCLAEWTRNHSLLQNVFGAPVRR